MINTSLKSSHLQDEDTKKHNTSITSIESFRIVKNTGQLIKEKENVLKAIKENQPVTSRMLSSITGIERTNITRSLFDLVHDNPAQVKEAYIGKCMETKRAVKYYSLIDWPQIPLSDNC